MPTTRRKNLLIRCDGAGASHNLLDSLVAQGTVRGRKLEYSVGYAVTEKIREAIKLAPENVWTPATGQLPFLEARHRAHARVEDRILASA